LSQLDAGSWHSRQYAGEPPCSLAALARFCLASGYALNIEIKPSPGSERQTGQTVAAQAERLWAQAQTPPLLSSFQPESLAGALQSAPNLPRALLLDTWWDGWLQTATALQCCAIVANHRLLDADTLSAVLGRGSYTLIFVTNAGVASRATMLATAAHFAEQSAAGVSDFRGWAIVTLDFAAESSRESKPPLLRALLARLRASPVGVLRKGQTLACFSGQPSVRLVGEWIAKLRMGEVEWARLSDDGPLSPAMDEEPG
jgi:hypothetical protein